jgi:hypothetical protein
MSTTTGFDLARFARAVEERDAASQLSMYGPEARVTIVDKITQPGAPRVLSTREEIKSWLEDTYGRDMTHKIQSRVQDDDGAAFTLDCRYPDGINVKCATVFKTEDGQIADQTILQVWDEH